MRKWNKYYSASFLLIALVISASNILQKIDYSPDDTYIYMQYARNIAHGDGYAFNANEPSYGVTSLLWPVILAPSYLMGINAYWSAKFLDLIFFILAILFFYKLAGSVQLSGPEDSTADRKDIQNISAGIFALNIWFVRWAFTGMETSFAVFLVILIFYLMYKERYALSGLFTGVFYLTRPEGFVLFLVILVWMIYKRVRFKSILLSCVLFIIVTVPFLFYAETVFHTIVPNTALGKTTFSFGLDIYLPELKRIFGTIIVSDAIAIMLSVYVTVYLILKRKIENYVPVYLWIIGLIVLYVVTDSDIISRYLLIIIPFFTILGLQVLRIYPARPMMISCILFVLVLIQSQFIFYNTVKPSTDNFISGMNGCLIPIGKWFDSSTPPGTRILVNDVGAIGYFSNRYIYDAAALINNNLSLNKNIMSTPLEERQNPVNLLKFVKADYVVLRDTIPENLDSNKTLEFKFYREFPGLGISDQRVKFYKVYKVLN